MRNPTVNRVEVNGVTFAYLELGTGPLALCLHGFPDSAHTWRHLMPRLADAGYRAVAPFTRGYAPTSVPADGRYQSGMLAADAIGLHDALGADGDAVIIGHDWGAVATWGAASAAPQRWRRVVGLAVPFGSALGASFLANPDQLKRSWYMFFFQHALADVVVGANDLAFIDMLWVDWSPGFDGSGDAARAKDCLRDPANLAAALGYYRAALGAGAVDPELADVQAVVGRIPSQPTLYLHGAGDACIGPEVVKLARAEAPEHVQVELVDGAGHFLHLEQPEVVGERIVTFLA